MRLKSIDRLSNRSEIHQAQSQIHSMPQSLFLYTGSPESNGELFANIIRHFISYLMYTVRGEKRVTSRCLMVKRHRRGLSKQGFLDSCFGLFLFV